MSLAVLADETRERALPWSLRLTLGGMVAVGFLVMREPAPSDLMFPVAAAAVLLGGHALSPLRLPLVVLLSSLGMITTNLAGMMWSDFPVKAVRYGAITIYMVLLALLLALVVGRHGRQAANMLVSAYGIAGLAAALIGLGARFGLMPNSHLFFRGDHGLRIKSTFKDPNVFAPFMVGAVMLWLAALVESKRIRLSTVAALGIGVAAVLLAFSRGAWAHLLLSSALYVGMHIALIRDRHSIKRLSRVAVLASFSLIPGIAILLSQPELFEYFQERLSFQSYDSERFGNQGVAWSLAMQNPVGVGPGMWETIPDVIATHNVYARVLTENGILGLISFLAFAFALLYAGLRVVAAGGPNANLAAACMAVSMGALGESFIIDTLHWRHLFFFFGLPLGLYLASRQETAAPTTHADHLRSASPTRD